MDIADEGDISPAAIEELIPDNNLVIHTKSGVVDPTAGTITVYDPISYDSPHSLTFLATLDLKFLASVQNAGAGALNLVAGWDETTGDPGFDPGDPLYVDTPFDLAAILGNPDSYGRTVTINDLGNNQSVSVGSAHGRTTVAADELYLTASDQGQDQYAQLGFRGPASGDIDVQLKGKLTLTGGSGDKNFAQLGHGGFGDPNAHSGSITVDTTKGGSPGQIDLIGGTAAEAYVQIGHGGSYPVGDPDPGSPLDQTGAIGITSGYVDLTAGTSVGGAYAQIGHGGVGQLRRPRRRHQRHGTEPRAQRRRGRRGPDRARRDHLRRRFFRGHHGSRQRTLPDRRQPSPGPCPDRPWRHLVQRVGAIPATSPSGRRLSLSPGRRGHSDAYTQIGHGGTYAHVGHSGDINVSGFRETGGQAVRDHSDATPKSVTGAGGRRGTSAAPSSVRRRLRRADGGESKAYAQIGHGGKDTDGSHAGAIAVWEDDPRQRRAADRAGYAYGQMGHGGHSSTGGPHGGRRCYAATEGFVDMGRGPIRVGPNSHTYAQIGHGGASSDGSHDGNLTVFGGDQIGWPAGEATGATAYAQIGHGGFLGNGSYIGILSATSDGTVSVIGGDGLDSYAYAQIGHGGFLGNGDHVGDIGIAGPLNVEIFGGNGDDSYAYAQVGHGGSGSSGSHGGSLVVAGGDFYAFGGSGLRGAAYAQAGHGGHMSETMGGGHSGGIQVTAVSMVDVLGASGGEGSGDESNAYAQIGHGGAGSDGNHSGLIDVFGGDGVDVIAGDGDQSAAYSQIGHGGLLSNGDRAGDISVATDGYMYVIGDGTGMGLAYGQIGHGGGLSEGDADGNIELFTSAADELIWIGGGNGDDSGAYAQVGHGGLGSQGLYTGNITVTGGDYLPLYGGHGERSQAYAQIGHGGFGSIGGHIGDIGIFGNTGTVSLDGGGGGEGGSSSAYAQIGHGGHSAIGDHNGAIQVDSAWYVGVNAGGSDGGSDFAQIGHGGWDSDGSHIGDISVSGAHLLELYGGGFSPNSERLRPDRPRRIPVDGQPHRRHSRIRRIDRCVRERRRRERILRPDRPRGQGVLRLPNRRHRHHRGRTVRERWGGRLLLGLCPGGPRGLCQRR